MFLRRMETDAPRFECMRCGRQYLMVGGEFEEQFEVTSNLREDSAREQHSDFKRDFQHTKQENQGMARAPSRCPCCAALHWIGVPHA